MILVSEYLLFWIGLGIGLVCIIAWAFLSRRRAAEDRIRDTFLEARLSGGAEDVLERKGRQLGSEEPRGS
jgi:hypothetical protein